MARAPSPACPWGPYVSSKGYHRTRKSETEYRHRNPLWNVGLARGHGERGKSLRQQFKELFAEVGSFFSLRENFHLTQEAMEGSLES